MDYYCHSCQEETQIIAAHYLTCERCLSDFVEEIEPIQDNRTTWSDEDETLASLWNSVFRNGFNDTPLPGTYPQEEEEYGNAELTNVLYPNDNEPTDTTLPNDNEEEEEEEETGYHYPYNEYYQQYDENEEGEEEYNPIHPAFLFFDDYREHVNDDEEPNSPWPTNPNSDDEYQDLVSNNSSSSSNNRSNLNENEESSVDYLSVQDEIGNEYVDWRSISSDDNNYEEFENDPNLLHRYSYDNDSYEEETGTGEEEDSDVVGLGELLRETLTVDSDVNVYPDVEDNYTTDMDEYDPPPPYYESEYDSAEFDPDYHLSTLLRIIQEQHETTFTDPSNWEYDLSRDVQSASEESIASLPRYQLNRGDTGTYNDCSICLNSLGFNVELINLPCMHGFHSGCIEQWLQVNASCPICRSPACTSS